MLVLEVIVVAVLVPVVLPVFATRATTKAHATPTARPATVAVLVLITLPLLLRVRSGARHSNTCSAGNCSCVRSSKGGSHVGSVSSLSNSAISRHTTSRHHRSATVSRTGSLTHSGSTNYLLALYPRTSVVDESIQSRRTRSQ